MFINRFISIIGEWRVASDYKEMFVINDKHYYAMSKKQRMVHTEKFSSFVLPKDEHVVQQIIHTDTDTDTSQINIIEFKNVPLSITKEMCKEACEILCKSERIIKGFASSFFVKNEKDPNHSFHVIVDPKKGDISCLSEKCYRYKSFGVCSHVISVGATIDKLETLVDKINKKRVKISALADY